MSDENNNNNNEASISKTNINPNDIDIRKSTKNLLKSNTIDDSLKKDLISNLLTSDNIPSSKTLLDDEKTLAAQDNETVAAEGANLLKRSREV